MVHNETSTGVTSDIGSVRKALDAAGHPALLLVDTISALGSVEFKQDEWGVDVSVASSQKGSCCPGPGLQCREPKGPGCQREGHHAACLLGLGRHPGSQ